MVLDNNDLTTAGQALNAFEVSDGYVIFGDKSVIGGHYNIFYVKIDKTDGHIVDPFKFYSASNFGFSDNNYNIGSDGYNMFKEFKEIKDNTGTIIGFLCATGLFNHTTGVTSVNGGMGRNEGGLIIKFDATGNLVPSFGSYGNGMQNYSPNIAPNTFFEAAIRSVCVNYDASGNPQQIAFSGTRRNGNAGNDNDVYIGNVDFTSGALIWDRTFTEANEVAAGYAIPSTHPYLCSPDTSPPANKNLVEFGDYIRQTANGGDYVMVVHNRWSILLGNCFNEAPNTLHKQSYIDFEMGLLRGVLKIKLLASNNITI